MAVTILNKNCLKGLAHMCEPTLLSISVSSINGTVPCQVDTLNNKN